MTSTRILTSGLIAGTLCIGIVNSAEAANLVNTWEVVEAQSSAYNSSGGHAFWFPELVNGGKFVFDGDALFNEYDDGTAHFFGSIVAANDANKKWDFDIWFDATQEGWGGPKKELHSSAYIENGGTVDTDTWRYYDFSSTKQSTLSADTGAYTGQTLELSDYTNGEYPVQVGYGANGKNTKMGLSTWFEYKGSQNSSPEWNSDINVTLKEIPEPTMSFLTLGLLGFAGYSLRRKKSSLEDSQN